MGGVCSSLKVKNDASSQSQTSKSVPGEVDRRVEYKYRDPADVDTYRPVADLVSAMPEFGLEDKPGLSLQPDHEPHPIRSPGTPDADNRPDRLADVSRRQHKEPSYKRKAWQELRKEQMSLQLEPLRLPEFDEMLGRQATDLTDDASAVSRGQDDGSGEIEAKKWKPSASMLLSKSLATRSNGDWAECEQSAGCMSEQDTGLESSPQEQTSRARGGLGLGLSQHGEDDTPMAEHREESPRKRDDSGAAKGWAEPMSGGAQEPAPAPAPAPALAPDTGVDIDSRATITRPSRWAWGHEDGTDVDGRVNGHERAKSHEDPRRYGARPTSDSGAAHSAPQGLCPSDALDAARPGKPAPGPIAKPPGPGAKGSDLSEHGSCPRAERGGAAGRSSHSGASMDSIEGFAGDIGSCSRQMSLPGQPSVSSQLGSSELTPTSGSIASLEREVDRLRELYGGAGGNHAGQSDDMST